MVALQFCGCAGKYAGLTTDADTVIYRPGADVTVDFPSETAETYRDEIGTVVYWIQNSEIWHTNDKCPSLSRSGEILSGSADEAKNAGKSRACKRCS